MSDTKAAASSGGIGFSGLLCILFIGLKLTGHIAWSWVWVLSPVWIPLGIVVAFVAFAAVMLAIANVGDFFVDRGRRKRRAVERGSRS